MKIDFEKIHRIREEKKMTVKGFCELSGIGRTTLWDWEHDKSLPDEYKVKKMAKALGISISEISDIPEEQSFPQMNFNQCIKESVSGWLNVLYGQNNNKEISSIKSELNSLEKQLINASIIIKAFMSSLRSIVYIKDLSSNYIIANSAFLNNISLVDDYEVIGKKDSDFFAIKEARANENEDCKVIKTGEAIIQKQDYIPGSRKKKWGLISKYPILSHMNTPVGLIAIISDITEQRVAAKRRIILEKALDSIEDTCISIGRFADNNHKFIFEYINEKMKDIFMLESKSDFEKIPERWNTMLSEESKKVFNQRRHTENFPAHYVYTATRPRDNKKIIVQDSVYKSEDRLISIVRDITEKQENLKEIKAFDFVFKSLPLALEIYDENQNLVYSNNKTEDIFGYKTEDVFNNTFWLENIIHPKDRKSFLKHSTEERYPSESYRAVKPNRRLVKVKSTFSEEYFLDKKYSIITHTLVD